MKKGFKQLTEAMQSLCAIANRIVSGSENVSRIERDLMLQQLRELYDITLQLSVSGVEDEDEKKEPQPMMNDQSMVSATMMATMAAMSSAPQPPIVEVVPAPVPEPVVTEPVREEVIVPVAEPVKEEVVPVVESVKEEVVEEKPVVVEPATTVETSANDLDFGVEIPFEPLSVEPQKEEQSPIVEEKPVQERVAEVKIPSDDFEDIFAPVVSQTVVLDVPATPMVEPVVEQPVGKVQQPMSVIESLQQSSAGQPSGKTIGESFAATQSTIASNMPKVEDLRTVININDKFSFMSELFKGGMKAYNDFILRLNSMTSREEALQEVSMMAAQYHWDNESAAVKNFMKIFDKKF